MRKCLKWSNLSASPRVNITMSAISCKGGTLFMNVECWERRPGKSTINCKERKHLYIVLTWFFIFIETTHFRTMNFTKLYYIKIHAPMAWIKYIAQINVLNKTFMELTSLKFRLLVILLFLFYWFVWLIFTAIHKLILKPNVKQWKNNRYISFNEPLWHRADRP